MENENENEKIEIEEKATMMGGLKSLGFGVLLLILAYYFYSSMTSYENGESVRVNRILFLVYNFLGKNITTGLVSLIGLFVGYGGIKEMMNANKEAA